MNSIKIVLASSRTEAIRKSGISEIRIVSCEPSSNTQYTIEYK